MNGRIYLHEIVDITLHNREKYFEHAAAGWIPCMKERRQKLVGMWGTVGCTGNWPEVINLWEWESWETFADNLGFETLHPGMQDPFMKTWWAEAQKLRHHGYDRILIPAEYCPTIDDLIRIGRIGHLVYLHERIAIAPGKAQHYLDLMRREWLPVASDLGMELIGAWRTSARNDSEAVAIWGLKDWAAWAKIERGHAAGAPHAAWRTRTEGLALDWIREAMCPGPHAPVKTGRHLVEF